MLLKWQHWRNGDELWPGDKDGVEGGKCGGFIKEYEGVSVVVEFFFVLTMQKDFQMLVEKKWN